ncbi:isoprenylcysteine carboxyl methyltransferase family protein [Metabacillus idriensis]|uniref:isoprenylcysteine carboxyl methyltransferase family protein n=1 Tax=Metabacillus idriensis TaxID=324768 RepID=UPI002966FE02|nr:isoprenylcysteine carboxylmethyltransferase family protein [Metabacillus idriensis]
MIFYIFLVIIILQRLTELFIAKRNEAYMKTMGGEEYGQKHYPIIVAVHILFLFSLMIEVIVFNKEVSPLWLVILPIIAITQIIRYWAVFSLGSNWNTKIIIVPNLEVVSKGPYKFMRHPNYLVVAVEILFLPVLFQAYATAILFTVLNAAIMAIRIPAEEKALLQHTDYEELFMTKRRFLPRKE